MNNKGFTLVELLATMAILAIIMAIAIPNVINVMDKTKNTMYIEDAKKLATLAEYKVNKDTTINIPVEGCVILLKELDQTDLSTGPNDGEYDTDDSFVLVERGPNMYNYSVQLIENYNSKTRGLVLTSYEDLTQDYVQVKDRIKDRVGGAGFNNPSNYIKCVN